MDSHEHIDAEITIQETFVVESFGQHLASVRSILQQTNQQGLWSMQQAAGYTNVPVQRPYANSAVIGAYEQRIFEVARSFNDLWLPPWVQGWYGYELTGLWRLPTHPGYVTYLRQCGPYVNVLCLVNNTLSLYGCGLLDPQAPRFTVQGWLANPYGIPFEYTGTPYSHSTIAGSYTRTDMGGQFQFDLERFI